MDKQTECQRSGGSPRHLLLVITNDRSNTFVSSPPVPVAVHRRTSGALERTLFFVRFSFGLHPPDESTFVRPSVEQSSGETSDRTKGLSSGQTLAPKTQLGTLLTVLLPLPQFLYCWWRL